MKPLIYVLAGAAVLALAAGPSAAQGRGGDQGGGRATTGAASGGGGGAVASGGGGGSSSGGGGGFGSGHGPASAGSASSGGGSSSGGYSGPPPSGSSGVPSRSGAYSSPSGGRVNPANGNSSYVREIYGSPGDRAVPRGSRPNPGGPTVGQAVLRPNPPVHGGGGAGGGGAWYPSYPYYPFYGALGLGVYGYYYDPWWYWGSPYGYAPWGYWGSPYGYDSGYYGNESGGRGGLKLKVEPTFAEVYVDGYYMGIVDDFDGTFQRMELEVGPHRIEIRAPGHETLGFDVRIEFGDTVTFRGVLQPLVKK